MLLYKPIVSLIAAFAAASSVAASTTPLRRGGSPPINQCNPVNQQCCNQVTSNPSTSLLGIFNSIGLPLVANVPIGINCSPLVLGSTCSGSPVCCTGNKQNVNQQGIVNVNSNCSPLNL